MSRQEERKQAAQQRYSGESQYQVTKAQAFLTGARWADKTIIDKACEWLIENMYIVVDCCDCVRVTYAADTVEEVVEDFRKAMEE